MCITVGGKSHGDWAQGMAVQKLYQKGVPCGQTHQSAGEQCSPQGRTPVVHLVSSSAWRDAEFLDGKLLSRS